ncbi:hypothetical protein AAVH_24419 [Aphelenchoides avenae]|nr:hypothetical protein AAVH_24419 [Aphelenchus avenae]
MFFERDCESNITADYFADGPNKLGIRNACVKKDGSISTAYGTAYQKDKSKPGQLKATFASPAFQWMPFLWADYWVLLLEDNYEWALIGEPNRTYLWILSREPTLTKLIFDMLTHHIDKLGYDASKLIVSGVIL